MAEQIDHRVVCHDEKNSDRTPIVEMHGIKKAYGSIKAVAHADLKLYSGEIHALVGGNGSGKSTLISVLSGANKADAGEIFIDGEKVTITEPKMALDMGIQTIYQNLFLFEMQDVTTNLFAGRELIKPPPFSWIGCIDRKKMRARAVEEFKRLKIDMPSVDMLVARLSGGQRQSIACARAMMWETPKVLIMDEPTAALGVSESQEIYRLMEVCRDEGAAIIFISHDMVEVMAVSNRITVMRLGETIAQLYTKQTSGKEIVGLITGAIEPSEVMGKRIQ